MTRVKRLHFRTNSAFICVCNFAYAHLECQGIFLGKRVVTVRMRWIKINGEIFHRARPTPAVAGKAASKRLLLLLLLYTRAI